MHSEVIVTLAPGQEFRLSPEPGASPDHEAARRWLDAQFVQLECEPLRSSGKVLFADKVLVIAQAAGERLLGDAAWSAQFAAACVGALACPIVRIDVPAMAVRY